MILCGVINEVKQKVYFILGCLFCTELNINLFCNDEIVPIYIKLEGIEPTLLE